MTRSCALIAAAVVVLAGFRVREQLASLNAASDAVGRTDQVTGSITVESDAARPR